MSYIGATPQIGGYHKLDAITTDGSASYTMQLNSGNFVPESANHLIVSVNGVIQAPTDSFTVSGSTITFASTLSVSDTIDFIMALGNTLDIGTPSDSTVSLSKLTATGTPSASTFLRGDNSWASAGGTNTPAFSAQVTDGSTISIPSQAVTKVTFATEIYDSDSKYDTSTSRFTPTVAGKYFVYARLSFNSDSDFDDIRLHIHKNGTRNNSMLSRNEYYTQIYIYDVLDLNTTDYVEIYAYQGTGGSLNILTNEDGRRACFGAYRIIGA